MPGIHIERWDTGLVTNRAATTTPVRVAGQHVIQLNDALIDGLNVEVTPAKTLARRPGWPKYCTATYGAETPKALAGAILNGTIYNLLDTSAKVYTFDTTTLTSIYTKTTTNQTFFQQVGNKLFMSDGAVNQKWDGSLVTNNGIVAPTAAPSITNLNLWDTVGATQTCHAWVPNASYNNATANPLQYFLMAPTGEMQWAVVPAGATLKSQSSAPNWATGFGSFGYVTNDGTMTWVNIGAVKTWAANSTAFNASAYLTTAPTVATVGATTANFSTTGSTSNNWTTSTADAGFDANSTGSTNTLLIKSLGLSVPTGSTVQGVQITLNRAAIKANMISDVTVKLLKAGVAAGNNKALAGFWPKVLTGNAGTPQIYGSNTDLWGTSISPADVADAGFGVEVVASANSTHSSAAAIYYPITISVTYAVSSSGLTATTTGSVVKDKNGNLQVVTTSGTTGAGPGEPSWSTTIGGTTTDNTVTWKCLGTANTLSALTDWVYGYSFHTESAHTSTLSPILKVMAPIIGPNVPITGVGSGDTQCDSVDLYRSPDGGSLLLYDTSAPNVNASTSWTISDTALDTDLNALLIGPVALANAPAPTGMTLLAYHMGRLWGVVGNLLYFSAGFDCINGDGMQAWPPANVFTLSAPITALAAHPQGLVVFTAVDISVVLGGPQIDTFWVQPLIKNCGVQSPNCVFEDDDNILAYTSQRQMVIISTGGKQEFGFSVAPTLATNFSPSTSWLAVHRAGQDQGAFISDGSTNAQRYNMNAESWDPIQTPTGGIGPLESMDTAVGTRTLLSTANGFIVKRDPTTFQDSGSSYTAFATVGSITLSPPGEPVAKIKSLVLVSAAVGTALTVAVLPNEISGSFTTIPFTAADPYQLTASSTITMKRYDWLGVQSMLSDVLKHLQIKITMPTEAAKNEIYSLSLV